ncbi:unnamed protein product [Schistosoma haematobium]|nr:unnamed protein product [Schistosoma haematobium]
MTFQVHHIYCHYSPLTHLLVLTQKGKNSNSRKNIQVEQALESHLVSESNESQKRHFFNNKLIFVISKSVEI